jgi:hypothetical protein
LKYLLMHSPGKCDDCIAMMLRKKPNKVVLNLKVCEYLCNIEVIVQFRGEYVWSFNEREVKYEEVYGGFLLHESDKHKYLALYRANERLKDKIEKLLDLGVEIVGSDKRFEYSMPLKG